MTSPRDEVATSSAASGAVEDPGLLGAANHDPRHWATPEHPDPHPFGLARDHPDTSASAWASISASVNTSPASKPKPPSPLDRRVARIELTGSPRLHHNNSLRGWGPIRCACTMPDTNRQGE